MTFYSGLQVSCPGEIGNRQLEMSLCKLLAFVLDSLTNYLRATAYLPYPLDAKHCIRRYYPAYYTPMGALSAIVELEHARGTIDVRRRGQFIAAVRPAVQLLQIQEVRTWTRFNV